MRFFTADLCDENPEKTKVLGSNFKSFGGIPSCKGRVITFKLDKNNKDLAGFLKNTTGEGIVIVVDTSMEYYAVVGDNLLKFANENKFEGIIVNGYVRDTQSVKVIETALFAKGTCPRKYIPEQSAKIGVDIIIDDVAIQDGDYIYADCDGIVVSKEKLV